MAILKSDAPNNKFDPPKSEAPKPPFTAPFTPPVPAAPAHTAVVQTVKPVTPVVHPVTALVDHPVTKAPVSPASILSDMDAKHAEIAALKIKLAKAHTDLDTLIGHHNRIK